MTAAEMEAERQAFRKQLEADKARKQVRSIALSLRTSQLYLHQQHAKFCTRTPASSKVLCAELRSPCVALVIALLFCTQDRPGLRGIYEHEEINLEDLMDDSQKVTLGKSSPAQESTSASGMAGPPGTT